MENPDKNMMASGDPIKGGSYIGNSYWSSAVSAWPLVTLTVSPHCLRLNGYGLMPFDYTVPRDAIQELVISSSKLLAGATARLQIVHTSTDVPPYIVFGTFSVEKLL